MTPRRLLVLIRWLPAEAPLWAEMHAAEERAKKPTREQIKDRQAYYDRKAKRERSAS